MSCLEVSVKTAALLATLVLWCSAVVAQEVQVNRSNKTIAVTAEDSVSVDAEVALVKIGYHNFGTTYDAAYKQNIRTAEAITAALLKANVPSRSIETADLKLERVEP